MRTNSVNVFLSVYLTTSFPGFSVCRPHSLSGSGERVGKSPGILVSATDTCDS